MECNLCKSGNIKHIGKFKGFNLFRCKECKLTFSILDKELNSKNLYERDYFEKLHPEFFLECTGSLSNKEKTRIYTDHLNEITKIKKSGKLLDIGCGSGNFLNEARKYGFDVYGIDISEYVTEKAKRIYGLKNIKSGKLTNGSFKKGFFDVITMNDVIEHVDNPNEILNLANSFLKKDGLLLVYTINENSLLYRTANYLHNISFGLIKKPIELCYPVHHLYHFRDYNLKRYLINNCFNTIYSKKYNMPLSANTSGGFIKKSILAIFYKISEITRSQFEIVYLSKKVSELNEK